MQKPDCRIGLFAFAACLAWGQTPVPPVSYSTGGATGRSGRELSAQRI